MPRKKSDIQKHTLNLRTGDYGKMQEMFPRQGAGFAIRVLIAKFVDQHYQPPTPREKPDLGVDLDEI